MASALLDKHLIFVTGKGGVGKSTVALTLGVLAARRGRRVIVAELAGNDELQRMCGAPGGAQFTEVELEPGLYTISVEPQRSMEEYLMLKLPAPAAQLLSHSKLFGAFAMATPGMRELLSVGKVWELSQPERRTPQAGGYDLVIVDSPASGHGVALLQTPATFAEIARVGPIARQGTRIAETLCDRDFTAVVAVTTPQEMPVNETLEVAGAFSERDLELAAVVVNGCLPDRFSAADTELLRRAPTGSLSEAARGSLTAALSQQTQRSIQTEQEQRLVDAFGPKLLRLPYLVLPAIDRAAIGVLADQLGEELA